jgi:hypothetical protein
MMKRGNCARDAAYLHNPVPPSQAIDVRLTLSFLWTKTINQSITIRLSAAPGAPCRLQLIVISHTHKSNIIPYFDCKCKINKAVIISGVSKLGHKTVTTEKWKPRGDVTEKGNATLRRLRVTVVAVGKQ